MISNQKLEGGTGRMREDSGRKKNRKSDSKLAFREEGGNVLETYFFNTHIGTFAKSLSIIPILPRKLSR